MNLNEQLLLGTFEWTINHLIYKADITKFAENYRNDEKGAAAYSPRVLLKAILEVSSNTFNRLRRGWEKIVKSFTQRRKGGNAELFPYGKYCTGLHR